MSSLYGRPPTGSLANRPSSRSGSTSSWGRGGAASSNNSNVGKTGIPPPTARAMAPGTARPVTGAVRTGALGFHVVDRPITQQGLGGIKGSAQGSGRVVQDKTFFQGELRQKSNMLAAEINKLNAEAESTNKENSNFAVFERRADLLADELRDLQGQLGDLNTLVDKLHTDSDISDIEKLSAQLRSKNQRDSQILDEVFSVRQQKENAVRDLERSIDEERRKSEAQINELDAEKRAEYFEVKEQNSKYLAEISSRQMELEDLTSKASSLQQEIKFDSAKTRSFALYEKLSELRLKKRDIEDSLQAIENDSGPKEKNRLLEQVKEDNQETSAMERRISELEEQAQRIKEALSQLDLELDSGQADKNNKYEELLKRDKEMQQFIETFDERKTDALQRNKETERKIVSLLDRIKVGLAKNEVLPSQAEHRELQSDLKFKEKEMKNSENTMEALMIERDRRTADLEKVNQLDTKLQAELKHLYQKIARMEEDLHKISNVDLLKQEAEAMKKKNATDRESLKLQRDTLRYYVQLMGAKHDGKRSQLHDNETFSQLGALEQRLRHQESNNFHLKEYISSKNIESDYKSIEAESLQLIDDINAQLGKILSMPPAR
ncbi:Intraflagellar transport protein 74 [Blyttiomyces sp. JEL0837]|nr:Intraflagellar transport protein 74 [Blyttiomyces sp. JEL0837]